LVIYNFTNFWKNVFVWCPWLTRWIHNPIATTKFGNIVLDNTPFCFQWLCWSLCTNFRSIGIVMKLWSLPKCGWPLSIPYHRVLKDVKKANAQNFFFLNDNFFPLFVSCWCCNIIDLFMWHKRCSHKGWWRHLFLASDIKNNNS